MGPSAASAPGGRPRRCRGRRRRSPSSPRRPGRTRSRRRRAGRRGRGAGTDDGDRTQAPVAQVAGAEQPQGVGRPVPRSSSVVGHSGSPGQMRRPRNRAQTAMSWSGSAAIRRIRHWSRRLTSLGVASSAPGRRPVRIASRASSGPQWPMIRLRNVSPGSATAVRVARAVRWSLIGAPPTTGRVRRRRRPGRAHRVRPGRRWSRRPAGSGRDPVRSACLAAGPRRPSHRLGRGVKRLRSSGPGTSGVGTPRVSARRWRVRPLASSTRSATTLLDSANSRS